MLITIFTIIPMPITKQNHTITFKLNIFSINFQKYYFYNYYFQVDLNQSIGFIHVQILYEHACAIICIRYNCPQYVQLVMGVFVQQILLDISLSKTEFVHKIPKSLSIILTHLPKLLLCTKEIFTQKLYSYNSQKFFKHNKTMLQQQNKALKIESGLKYKNVCVVSINLRRNCSGLQEQREYMSKLHVIYSIQSVVIQIRKA
eukprot:TRINITY_DN17619_c0_g1_i2.p2 TRINITY_DN17619_c0_g1~~TRINITY_DN17619_c0_g1_i2.p2  ORF type:complete len:202 (+),score=-23.28 TRINITY_DN17619_c0_g1_i2:466-1071(+)